MIFQRTALVVIVVLCFVLTACDSRPQEVQYLGQKLMLDMRYYCADGTPNDECKTPVTELLPEFAEIIVKGNIGGVILFAENLHSVEQIVALNYAIQSLAKREGLPPLFIAVDQEGGRVARLPDEVATRFVGNMAIGATFANHNTLFSTQVNKGIAKSLKLLGFNVNFAPTVDVNVNPDNPVINVRSYGESPAMVADMGIQAVAAMQQENILSAIKHFPGHGDTHVDSHTGLPLVERDRHTINRVDLLPFTRAIGAPDAPAMVMTAHIQYPALDDTLFIAKTGEQTLVPATLSRKILTDLLREELNYQGLIVTDALDMAGIAHYVNHRDAVIKTFNAGADIALMPFTIRNPEGITVFWSLFNGWLKAIESGELSQVEMEISTARILAAKRKYQLNDFTQQPLSVRQSQAKSLLPSAENQQIERALAAAALTKIYDNGVLPLTGDRLGFIMPDEARCVALTLAFRRIDSSIETRCLTSSTLKSEVSSTFFEHIDSLVIGDITPQHSLAEMGGMDDIATWRSRPDKAQQAVVIANALQQASEHSIPSVFVALRAPYVIGHYRQLADAAVATFGYNVHVSDGSEQQPMKADGAVFDALAEALLGKVPFPGVSPVTVDYTNPQ